MGHHHSGAEAPSASAESGRATPRAGLDRAVREASDGAARFAAFDAGAKAALLRQCIAPLRSVAERWVRSACEAKRIPFDAPVAAEEWLGGPVVTIRNARLLAESLERYAATGSTLDKRRVRARPDGRVAIDVFPTSRLDAALFSGFSCEALLAPGATVERTVAEGTGPRTEAGGTALILGAGNVSSIPAMDALSKLFAENATCVLKMNPVNEWLGPILEDGLAPLVNAGYLRVVYGGADEGSYLCGHPRIGAVHITGSDRSHDAIVWGPPGAERERRKRADDPLLRKPITSELGNVSPVVVVPGPYSAGELRSMARNVASMVANNGSFNCNAAKVLVTSSRWEERDLFLGMVASELASVPPRHAYYPGAAERWEAIAGVHPEGWKLVPPRTRAVPAGSLPWLLVPGLDPAREDEPMFRTEPFCAVLGETALDADGPDDFLARATAFCNDRLWGTLCATVFVHPRTERECAAALDRAVLGLRYGAVAINHWPGLVYGLVSPPWGGHPSSTLSDIRSGIGWVHNTFLLRDAEKSVLRGPLVVKPTPAWFCGNPAAADVARKLVSFEASPSALKVPGIALAALRG
jgi:aldehyde dehydrogenase (NAD(P)+)